MVQDERQRLITGANDAAAATGETPATWNAFLWEWAAIVGTCIALWLVLVLGIAAGILTVKYLVASFQSAKVD
jgi:hypothetical protein